MECDEQTIQHLAFFNGPTHEQKRPDTYGYPTSANFRFGELKNLKRLNMEAEYEADTYGYRT